MLSDNQIKIENLKERQINGGWRSTHLAAIRDSDIVIALGGSDRGTGQVVYFSEIEAKPFVVIPIFEGAAGKVWNEIKHYYNQEMQAKLMQKPDINTWSKDIINIAEKTIHNSRFRTINIRDLILKLIIGICLTIIWFYLLFTVQPPFGNVFIFIGMLITSSLMGSTLRNELIKRNIIISNWGISNYLLDCLIGILLILPVYCIPQLFGYMLNGEPAKINTIENARRVGFELSILSFIAALFQEEAFKRAGNFIKTLIK
jgi:hypothetical protein